jgi:hypothetical protein
MSLIGASMPGELAAQSELDAADAQEFMGNWLVTIQGDQGDVYVELGIADDEGKVAGSVKMVGLGEQPVTDITREDDTLQFELEADAQGQIVPILVRITPDGENLAVYIELMDGEFTAEGVGTRMAS